MFEKKYPSVEELQMVVNEYDGCIILNMVYAGKGEDERNFDLKQTIWYCDMNHTLYDIVPTPQGSSHCNMCDLFQTACNHYYHPPCHGVHFKERKTDARVR